MAKGLADVLAEQRNRRLPAKPTPRITPRAQTSVPLPASKTGRGGILFLKALKAPGQAKLYEGEPPEELGDRKEAYGTSRKHWGYHLHLDIAEGNKNIDSPPDIKRFFAELLKALKLKALSEVVCAQVEKGGEEGRGTSAVQIITTSTITFHGDDDEWSAYIDCFICNDYDPQIVLDLVERHFEPKHIGVERLTRDAGKWPAR